MSKTIYKICPRGMWREAEKSGRFKGAPVDLADGFIHFSTARQVRETAAKHFSGRDDLVLAAIDESRLLDSLKYEISRNGELFPHLYAPLDMSAVLWCRPLPLDANGIHVFPATPE